MLKQIRKLCKPAYVYLVLSAITIILMMVQNAGASGTYKVGMYQCPCDNTAGIFLGKAIYVAFWTFALNALCKSGYTKISWLIMLFPGFMMTLAMVLYVVSGRREGMQNHGDGGGHHSGGGGGGGGGGRPGNTTHHVGSAGGGHDNYAPVRHRSKWGKIKHDFEKEGNMRKAFVKNPIAGMNKVFQSKWMQDTSMAMGMVGSGVMMAGLM